MQQKETKTTPFSSAAATLTPSIEESATFTDADWAELGNDFMQFTPCDFAFPTDGKRAEATPNTEMILVSDVDLNLLNELHTYGSVRNLRDRRHDLYELKVKK